jgi:hypothetical protein
MEAVADALTRRRLSSAALANYAGKLSKQQQLVAE